MDSSRPAAALKAMTAPPSRPPAPKPLVDTDTIQIADTKSGEDEAKPLALAKTFDSFDATMRLMAQTGEVDEFRDYITQTQKMRAYRGKIEPGSPLAAAAAPAPAAAPKEAPRIVFDNPAIGTQTMVVSSSLTNLVAMGAIVILALAAVGLLIALLVK
jgi:hypothetical protein